MTATMEAAAPAVTKVRPSKVWYWVFGALAVLSLLAAGAIWLTGRITVENQVKAFARFLAPNEAQLRFKRAGQYTIYYEYQSKVDDTEVDADSEPPDGIRLNLQDASGERIDLVPFDSADYDIGGYQAVSIYQALIDQPGEFRLSVGPPSLSQFAVSIGRGEPPTTDSWVTSAILVGAIGAGLGIVGLVLVGMARRRSRARAAADAGPESPSAATGSPWAAPAAGAGAASLAAPDGASVLSGGAPPPPPPTEGDHLAGVPPLPPLPPAPGTAPGEGVPPPPPASPLAGAPDVPSPPPIPPSEVPESAPSVAPPPLPEGATTAGGWAPPAAGTATEPGADAAVLPPPPE